MASAIGNKHLPLTAEQIVYDALAAAADAGLPCPSNEDLAELLGGYALSAPPQIIDRLVRSGRVTVVRYHKEREVTIVATGLSTAPARTPVPHWRDRPRDVPAPAEHALRRARPETASSIFAAARKMGRMPAEFLADLVWIGWAEYLVEEDQAGASEGLA